MIRQSIEDRLNQPSRVPTSHDPDPSARQWRINPDDAVLPSRDRDGAAGAPAAPVTPAAPVSPAGTGREEAPPVFAPQANRRRPSLNDPADVAPTTADPQQYRPQAAQPAQPAPPVYTPQARSHGFREQAPDDSVVYTRQPVPATQSSRPSFSFPRPGGQGTPKAPRQKMPRRRPRHLVRNTLLVLLVLVIAWPAFLIWDANRHLGRVDALSGAADTPGTTYLLAGSDSREQAGFQDDAEGQRADSIMLINVAPNGQTSMVSLPRDTYVNIPGYGWDKINATYAYGGPALLVQTVEALTGLTVDHFMEIGMGGVSQIVDAVGGIELCMGMDVDDPDSQLVWTSGCHKADGPTAIAFARMRKSDPRGDIGRAERQRQVVAQTVKTALNPLTLVNPFKALPLERAGAGSLTVDQDASGIDVLKLVMAFREAGNNGLSGAPPLASIATPTDVGDVVELRDETAPDFFAKVRDGSLVKEDMNQVDF